MAKKKGAVTIQVEIDSLDNEVFMRGLPKANFVKIDVEGAEKDVLLGMSGTMERFRPRMLIEMHGADVRWKIENAQKITKLLIGADYSIFHVESGKIINSGNCEITKEGYIYCHYSR